MQNRALAQARASFLRFFACVNIFSFSCSIFEKVHFPIIKCTFFWAKGFKRHRWGGLWKLLFSPRALLQEPNSPGHLKWDQNGTQNGSKMDPKWDPKMLQFCLESIKQSMNQSINQAINQSINQSSKQASNQAINRPINQSISQSTNQSIEQSIN